MAGKRVNGEGSVYRDKRGRWRGCVSLPQGGRKYVSGKTRKEVTEEVARLSATLRRGGYVATNTHTVGSWLAEWLQSTRSSLRPSTFYDYQRIVEKHLEPFLGKVKITGLRPEHISHLHQRLEADSLSPSRILKIHRVLSRALSQAVRWGVVDRNVASLVPPPRQPQKQMKFFDPTEVRTLVSFIEGDPWSARWHLALLGLRQGEALGLRWVDVNLDDKVLTVHKALQRRPGVGLVLVEPKSESSRRTLFLPDDVASSLRHRRSEQARQRLVAGSQWKNDHDLVFTSDLGAPIDAGVDSRRWRALLEQAGLPPIRLHDARHTAATMLMVSGVPVRATMEWLGHSQVSQTMRYSHVIPDVAKDTAARLGGTIFGG